MTGTRAAGMVLAACALVQIAAGQDAHHQRLVRDELDASRSSWIEAASFVRETAEQTGYLTVRIKGEVSTYLDVPVQVWRGFKETESLGSFYTEHIKGQYGRQDGEPLRYAYDAAPSEAVAATVRCAFNEDCETMILDRVHSAKKSILVAAYAFTRTRIGAALAEAHQRGVDVRVKVDKRQAEYRLARELLRYLEAKNIPVTRIDMSGEYAAMHNKFIVIDDREVLTGSYNFTTTAQVSNWENMVWLDSPEIATSYRSAWEAIAPH